MFKKIVDLHIGGFDINSKTTIMYAIYLSDDVLCINSITENGSEIMIDVCVVQKKLTQIVEKSLM